MAGHEFYLAVGKAITCEAAKSHRPEPRRFVWHHVLPQACGGETVPGNLVQLCDTDHYAIHDLMYRLAHNLPIARPWTRAQMALARRGYDAAVAAGTADRMPREG
jgi:hypothetical protein